MTCKRRAVDRLAKYSSSWAAYGNRIAMHTSWSLSRIGYIIILEGPHSYPGGHDVNGSGCESTRKYCLRDFKLPSRIIDIAMKGRILSNTKGNNVRGGHG